MQNNKNNLVFRDAFILDGTGADGCYGDVLVKDGRIAGVGSMPRNTGAEEVSLEGLTLAPGFIDLHTHSDVALLRDGRAESQIVQGVTLEVVGNCGHSCAPLARAGDVGGLTLGPQLASEPCWLAFEDYLLALEKARLGVNVAALVGHGALRTAVMDNPRQPAGSKAIKGMADLLACSLDGGAIGFSTGLEYLPGMCADTAEMIALCEVVARSDKLYATHIRNRDVQYELGLGEALATARATGVRLQVSHMTPKYGAPRHAAEHMVEMIAWARDEGLDAAYDVIPHNWGPTVMASILPAWVFEDGMPGVLARLRDPDQRAAIKRKPSPIWRLVTERRWDDIVLFSCSANPELVGATMQEIGRIRGVDPFDAVLDVLAEEAEGYASVTWAGRNFTDADITTLLQQPHAGVISDAITLTRDGPLGRLRWSPSTFGWIARFLQFFTRECAIMPLAEAVRRLTQVPAQRLGISDRGIIREGAWADLVVFDPAAVADHSTLAEPNAAPSGFRHVLVNGVFALRDGAMTEQRRGVVVRA